ncbi:hypothetical protein [Cytobacillus pseudoceanisediminis]
MKPINTSLATFMKIAITAVVIGTFIYGSLVVLMDGLSINVADYISHS